MKKSVLKRSWNVFLICSIGVLLINCSKDDAAQDPLGGDPGGGQNIVSGNPSLNSFLITKIDETIYRVDASTGQEEAIYTFSDLTDIEGVPEYENDVVYWATDRNAMNAVSLSGKSLLWDRPMLEYDFSSNNISSTVCFDGVCYATGNFGVVVAADQSTGEKKWHYTTDPDGELDDISNDAGTPIVYRDKVYIFSEKGFFSTLPSRMHVLDKETGALLSRWELPFDISGTPLIANDILYVPAKNLYAFDLLNDFETLWVLEADGMGDPFVLDNRLVVSGIPPGQTIDAALYCLDAISGNLIWEKEAGFDTLWNPIIIENVVFSNFERGSGFPFATNGRPFALKLSDGSELWRLNDVVIDHSPVYANGRLFFHGHDIGRTSDVDQNVGLISVDANTGEVLWLNNTFGDGRISAPLVVAQNGNFGPSYYRGN